MKFISTIFTLAITLWQFPSDAATWVEIGRTSEATVFIDIDSVRKAGNRVKSWQKWNWTKPQYITNSYPTKSYLAEKSLQVSECQNRTTAVLERVFYTELDYRVIVDSATVDERSARFSEVVPETIGEAISNFACSNFWQKPK